MINKIFGIRELYLFAITKKFCFKDLQKNLGNRQDLNESACAIDQEIMDRFRKRKCFADTELEKLASQAINSTVTAHSQNFKQQESNEMCNSNQSLLKQSNPIFTNPNYLLDTFAFNNYCSQLANLTNANIWYLQASLNSHKNTSHDFFKNNFNFLNLNNMMNSSALTYLLPKMDTFMPSDSKVYNNDLNDSSESKIGFDLCKNSNKLEDLNLNDETNLHKEKYSSKSKSFSVDSLLGVVK